MGFRGRCPRLRWDQAFGLSYTNADGRTSPGQASSVSHSRSLAFIRGLPHSESPPSLSASIAFPGGGVGPRVEAGLSSRHREKCVSPYASNRLDDPEIRRSPDTGAPRASLSWGRERLEFLRAGAWHGCWNIFVGAPGLAGSRGRGALGGRRRALQDDGGWDHRQPDLDEGGVPVLRDQRRVCGWPAADQGRCRGSVRREPCLRGRWQDPSRRHRGGAHPLPPRRSHRRLAGPALPRRRGRVVLRAHEHRRIEERWRADHQHAAGPHELLDHQQHHRPRRGGH